jgi:hypothetical protein
MYLLAGLVMISTAGPAAAQESKPHYNERPAVANVVMSNSRGVYDGTYSLSEVARVCGEVPAEMNFSGVPAFGVTLYPDSGEAELSDVTFDSKELVGGTTTSGIFFLSVKVQSPAIGSPPAYVLDTSKPNRFGTAELSYPEPGTLELRVKGVDDLGRAVDLVLTCKPRI